jgi:hypothetical protein
LADIREAFSESPSDELRARTLRGIERLRVADELEGREI